EIVAGVDWGLLQQYAGRQHLDIRHFRTEILLKERQLDRTQPRRPRAVGLQYGPPLNESGLGTRYGACGVGRLPIRPGFVRRAGVAGAGRYFDWIATAGLP